MEQRTIITVGQTSDFYTCKYCKVLLAKKNFNVLHHKCFSDVDLENEDICADPDSFIFRRSKNLEAYETVTERKDKAWSRYDEMLINAMKSRPYLWDSSLLTKNKNSQLVTQAWAEIVRDLEDKFDVETIKKRWKNLRDSYNRAKRKEKDIALGLTSPDLSKNEGFRFYKEMSFLSETFSPSTVIYHDLAMDDEQTGDISTPTFSSTEHSAGNVKRKKRRMDATKFQKDLMQFLKKPIEPEKELDRTDGFLLHLGEVLRKLPYRKRRLLEFNISKLVLEAEEECGVLDQ